MIEVRTDGDLRVLTLNRPDKANALTFAMLEALAEAVELAQAEAAKVLILTGAGKVFSAGMDLDAGKTDLPLSPVWARLSGAIAAFEGLSIAALNGTCAGGAMGMMLACDLRVCTPRATFFYPVMKLGFRPQPGDGARLAALVGPARAKQVLMTGARVVAETALHWGLVDSLDDDPVAVARDWASDALGAERAHIAAIKAAI